MKTKVLQAENFIDFKQEKVKLKQLYPTLHREKNDSGVQ